MKVTRRILGAALLSAALCSLVSFVRAEDEVPVVAAASDLKFAISQIVAAFKAETGKEVKVAFGSTGTFATQIRQGAPYQLFMAADETYVADLHEAGLTRDQGVLYAEGRIVIMVPTGSPLTPDEGLDALAAMLDAGTINRFAIANPDHAPYGLRAREALEHRGLWDKLQPRLVLGENVSQAAQFALSGDAEGGIIAYSLALAPEVRDQGDFALIPKDWHQPLLQRMALLKTAGPEAEAFYAYVQSPPARAIMEAYGFVLPE